MAHVASEPAVESDLDPRSYARAVRRLLVLLVAVGVAVRIARWLLPAAIWGDEAMLALNFSRDYLGLTRHLDNGQVAPVLFLWAERLVMTTLGASEWSLRLLPLLAALGGLILFWDFARRTVPPTAAALAVGLMAVSTWPVSMAATLKPYSGDLFWSALLLALAARWHQRPERLWPLATLAAVVPLALAASYPSVFVAGAVGLYLLPLAWSAHRRAQALFLAYSLAMLTTFALTYWLVGRAQIDPAAGPTGDYMRWYWRNGFPPESVWQWPLWLLESHTGRTFAYPVGDSNGGSVLTTLLVVVGLVGCWRNGSRPLLLVCGTPFALNFIAALLGKYPYAGCCRLSQHLAPAICLLAGVGGAALLDRWAPRRADRLVRLRWIAGLLIVLATVSLLLRYLWPDRDAISRLSRNLFAELRCVVEPDDRIAVLADPRTDVTTRWYLNRFGEQVVWLQPGDPLPTAPRIWFVTTHADAPDRTGHARFVRSHPDWHATPTMWYASRPDDYRHNKGVWWHCGITCLQRPDDPRVPPQLQALP
jgi:hypothetical protein